MVRRPRWIGVVSPVTVVPTGAGPTKLVLLSMVVVPLPSGRLSTVAAAPSVSAKAITAPPCSMSGRVQSSGLTTISALTAVSLAATNFTEPPRAFAALAIYFSTVMELSFTNSCWSRQFSS